MPHVTLQITSGGPLLDVAVGVSHARQEALVKANQPVPRPVPIRGLVDTGASCTCIDSSILKCLGLTPTGNLFINTPSTGDQPHIVNEYDACLILLSPNLNRRVPTVSVVEISLRCTEEPQIQALIGRDILSHCLLVYDGQEGRFTLAF